MRAYPRFIPRPNDQEAVVAKVAKAANVEEVCGPAAAKAPLTSANPGCTRSYFSSALADHPGLKSAGDLTFRNFSRFSSVGYGTCGSNQTILAVWAEGVARLQTMPAPKTFPDAAWQRVLENAEQFMDRWADRAVTLGWGDWEIWGVHRRSPWHRIDAMGLVLLLRRNRLTTLTDHEAQMVTATRATQTYRRLQQDPLTPAERALVWDLGGPGERGGAG